MAISNAIIKNLGIIYKYSNPTSKSFENIKIGTISMLMHKMLTWWSVAQIILCAFSWVLMKILEMRKQARTTEVYTHKITYISGVNYSRLQNLVQYQW